MFRNLYDGINVEAFFLVAKLAGIGVKVATPALETGPWLAHNLVCVLHF